MRAKGTSWLQRIAAIVFLSVWAVSTASAQTSQPDMVEVRQSDSLLNGALIGAGVAVASGLGFCTLMEPWENCRDDFGPMLKVGAIGAGIGMAVDALIRKKVYQTASGSLEVHTGALLQRRRRECSFRSSSERFRNHLRGSFTGKPVDMSRSRSRGRIEITSTIGPTM